MTAAREDVSRSDLWVLVQRMQASRIPAERPRGGMQVDAQERGLNLANLGVDFGVFWVVFIHFKVEFVRRDRHDARSQHSGRDETSLGADVDRTCASIITLR